MSPQPSTTAAARDLLARTSELPSSKPELLAVLSEYRHALFALVNPGTSGQQPPSPQFSRAA